MTLFPNERKTRALISLMTVLVLFLGLSAGILAIRQKELSHDLERLHAVKELELIGTLAREALIKRDYATVVQFLHSWGMENADIAAIDATATNGYRLALYNREGPALNTFTASTDVLHGDRKLMSIKIVKDLSEVDGRLNTLFLQGAAAFLFFAGAMGAALWYTLHRTAIVPLEEHVRKIQKMNKGLESGAEKQTADLVVANRTLKAEMMERVDVEEQLRRSKKELEQQNEKLRRIDAMKDGFVRDVSHELKTPVANQLMQLERLGGILDGKEAIDSVREILQVMEFGIRRQQATIGNVLLISRMEEGGGKLNTIPFRLDTLIEEVVKDYDHAISAFGIDLQMELEPVTLKSDRQLLRHVLSNIVDNAVKYRGHRNPHLRIHLEETNTETLILLEDNGIGFSGEEREKAFEKFYQSSSAAEGVGLGLSITRTILERLGGSVAIESEGKQKGSTFSVGLPTGEGRSRDRTLRLRDEK